MQSAEDLLWFLESNPSVLHEVLERFPLDIIKTVNAARLIWFQANDLTFYLTHLGIKALRNSGTKRKPLPHLAWKDNLHEMSADRAIELFAAPASSPNVTAEGVLVNETKKPKLRQPLPMIVRKEKHLPVKATIERI